MQTFLAMITISSGPGLNQLRLHRVENGLALGQAHPNGTRGKSGRVNHFGPKVAWICAYPDPTSTNSTAAWYMFGAPSTLYCWAMRNSTRLSSRAPTVLLLRPSLVPFALTTETELP